MRAAWSQRRIALTQLAFAAFFVVALAACAGGPPESAPPTLHGKAPRGFVDMRELEVAYLGEAGGGKGTLIFQGQTYPFEIAGGVGVSTIDASGEVYNLTDAAQFPGAYSEWRYGVGFGDASAADLWLENHAGRGKLS
jgi:hypothetical protein